MSSFSAYTRHPETGKMEKAEWLDNYFSAHHYGVRFPDGKIFDPDKYPDLPNIFSEDAFRAQKELIESGDIPPNLGELKEEEPKDHIGDSDKEKCQHQWFESRKAFKTESKIHGVVVLCILCPEVRIKWEDGEIEILNQK